MNLIQPEIFKQHHAVNAFFSESNRQIIHPDNKVQGLNLGINTIDEPKTIEKNTNALFNHLNWNSDHFAYAGQIHGNHVQIVEKPGFYKNTDGLVTQKTDIALGILVADCAAVLVADPVHKVIGAFHAGWKGTAGGIIVKGIKKMISLSASAEHFFVYISPCISLQNFEVGEEVAVQFPDKFVDRKSFTKPHVDLKGAIAHQFIAAGVPGQQVNISAECTMQNRRFYSYRREGKEAGRMLGLIKLEP
ncbi:MAG: peptidoglycan editing factor PgeF [Balneolaceae bacterium]